MKHRNTKLILLAFLLTAGSLTLWAQQGQEPDARRPDQSDRRSRFRRRFELTDEQQAELLEQIKAHRPEEYEQLMKMKESQPRRYRWILAERWRWYQRYKSMPAPVQKALLTQYEARVRIARIRKALADDPSDQQRRALAAKLKTQVAALFDANQTIRTHFLKKLEEKLERFRNELADRSEKRDKLIAEHVQKILDDPDAESSSRGRSLLQHDR
jgi:hypothetical protein